MKYLCLLTFMILFYACSTKVPEHLYKIHENCLTEQNAIDVANAYLIQCKIMTENQIKEREIKIIDKTDFYYISYNRKYVETSGYSVRCGGREALPYIIEINKNDCNIISAKFKN